MCTSVSYPRYLSEGNKRYCQTLTEVSPCLRDTKGPKLLEQFLYVLRGSKGSTGPPNWHDNQTSKPNVHKMHLVEFTPSHPLYDHNWQWIPAAAQINQPASLSVGDQNDHKDGPHTNASGDPPNCTLKVLSGRNPKSLIQKRERHVGSLESCPFSSGWRVRTAVERLTRLKTKPRSQKD